MSLSTPESCQKFLKEASSKSIADQLREDQRACREGKIPSLLARFVPSGSSTESEPIASYLKPDTDAHIPRALQRMQYAGVVDGITSYLANMEHMDDSTASPINETAFQARLDEAESKARRRKTAKVAPPGMSPFEVASNVLRGLRSKGTVTDGDTLATILQSLEELSASHDKKTESKPSRQAGPGNPRPCYICRYITYEMHDLYPSLCKPCGAFNIAESKLSMPANLNLEGKVVLVTGARVNLGFSTALRLLRCGATVIGSSRYPQDAQVRFQAEDDSSDWLHRLSIIGADFRTAKDVFRLVGTTKRLLGSRRLFILVNNAAQTLTDPVQAEQKAIQNESRLQQLTIEDSKASIVSNGYTPHIRGGSLMPGGLIEASKSEDDENIVEPFKSYSSIKTEPASALNESISNGSADRSLATQYQNPLKSSWMQSLDEIPYEDIITAHSVNTFVPLILIRELLPSMIDPQIRADISKPGSSNVIAPKPSAHIINVSSREGIFEFDRRSKEKLAKHVHTNMTKAGLNMITETEGDDMWRRHRIAMNSVDPGYLSAAPEMRRPGESQPLKFEDGAARVLWTVAIAEGKTNRKLGPIYKRFLKHFGSQEVNVGLGR